MELNNLDNYLDVVKIQDVLNRLYNNKERFPDIDFTSAQSVAEGIINYAGELGYSGEKNLTKLTDAVTNSMALSKNGKSPATKKDIYDSYRNYSARYKHANNVTPVESLFNERNELSRYQNESFNARSEIHELRVSRAKNHAIVALTLGVAFLFSGVRKKLSEIKAGIRYNKTKLVDENKLERQKMAIDEKLDVIRKNDIIFTEHGPWKEESEELENALGDELGRGRENAQENSIGVETEEALREAGSPVIETEEHVEEPVEEQPDNHVENIEEEEYETGARISDYGDDNEVGPAEPTDEEIDDLIDNVTEEKNKQQLEEISKFLVNLDAAKQANNKKEMNRLMNEARNNKLFEGTQFDDIDEKHAENFLNKIYSKEGQIKYGIFKDGKFIINDGSEEFKDNIIPKEARQAFNESLNNPKYTLNLDLDRIKSDEKQNDENVVTTAPEVQTEDVIENPLVQRTYKKEEIINQINNILGDEANYKNPKYAQSLKTEKAEELFNILDAETKEGGVLEGSPIAERYLRLKTKNIDRKKESFLEGLVEATTKPQGKEEYVTLNENGKIQFAGGNIEKVVDYLKSTVEETNDDSKKREEFFIKERINNILGDDSNYKNPNHYQSLNDDKTQELFEILEEYGKDGGLIANTPIAKAYNNLKTKNFARKKESLLENLMKSSERPQNQDEYVFLNEKGKVQIYNDSKYAPKAEVVDLKKIEEVKEENPEDFKEDDVIKEEDLHYKKEEVPVELLKDTNKSDSARI